MNAGMQLINIRDSKIQMRLEPSGGDSSDIRNSAKCFTHAKKAIRRGILEENTSGERCEVASTDIW